MGSVINLKNGAKELLKRFNKLIIKIWSEEVMSKLEKVTNNIDI